MLSIRIKDPVFKWISGILFFTVLNELWLVPVFQQRHSALYYNLFSVLDMIMWSVIFYLIHTQRTYRIIIIAAGLFYMAYSMAELFFIRGWHDLHTDSLRVYSICVITFSLLYYYSKYRKVYYNFIADPYFWLCSAVFLFHSIMFVNFTTQSRPDYWKQENAELYFYILLNTANSFYYGLIIFSILICYFKRSKVQA